MHSQKQPVTEEAVTAPASLQNLTVLQRMGKPLAGCPGPLGGILFAAPLVPPHPHPPGPRACCVSCVPCGSAPQPLLQVGELDDETANSVCCILHPGSFAGLESFVGAGGKGRREARPQHTAVPNTILGAFAGP